MDLYCSVLVPVSDHKLFLEAIEETQQSSDSADTTKSIGERKDKDKDKDKDEDKTIDTRRLNSIPKQFMAGEVIIAISDTTRDEDIKTPHHNVYKVLSLAMKECTDIVNLDSIGFTEEEVTVLPTLMSLSNSLLREIEQYLVPVESIDKYDNNDISDNIDEKSDNIHANSSSAFNESKVYHNNTIKEENLQYCIDGRLVPDRIRCIGYSLGGSIAAYTSMMLDGILKSADVNVNNYENGNENKIDANHIRKESLAVGKFKDRVSCVTLGTPPCISRSIVPPFITTIVCGDDIVPRTSLESIENMYSRVLSALEKGAGEKSLMKGLAWKMGSGVLSDISSMTGRSVSRVTGNQHDISSLSLPGRVFFVKARKLKEGATIQRILRGNWQEDILWQIHDILLTKKMFTHHNLDYYIKTLDRC